jgi:Sap, sulfolipid-1-addressing protein
MGDIAFLAFLSVLNPTLIAVTTVMLLLPHPGRLMVGYWLGAMITSVTLGLLIVFSLQGSSTVSTTKKTLSPLADIALGALFLVLAVMLAKGRDKRSAERHAKHSGEKKPPRWQRALRRGTAKTTFVIGAVLTLPGASYLAGLDKLSKLEYSTAVTVLVVIAFNLAMLILLEGPMIAFAVAPDWTPAAIDRAKLWAGTHGQQLAIRGLSVIGVALTAKVIIGLLV